MELSNKDEKNIIGKASPEAKGETVAFAEWFIYHFEQYEPPHSYLLKDHSSTEEIPGVKFGKLYTIPEIYNLWPGKSPVSVQVDEAMREANFTERIIAIDLECALLEDVLHGQEGKAITHIRHLLKALSSSPVQGDWVKDFPKDKECILLTASYYKEEWSFSGFHIVHILGEGEDGPGWYYALCELNGEEWGDINDLRADLYKVIELPQPPKQ